MDSLGQHLGVAARETITHAEAAHHVCKAVSDMGLASAVEDNPARDSAWLSELLPSTVATAELVGEGDPALLLAAERELLDRAVPMRAREFAAGRQCARVAVAKFGVVDLAIGRCLDRRPRWPRHLTGSITHTQGFAAAAVGERRHVHAIGIDAERIGAVSRDIWTHAFRPAEVIWLQRLPALHQAKAAALMFCAKEAFYKCQYEVTEQWLCYQDVMVECYDWTLDWGSFAVRPTRPIRLFAQGGDLMLGRFAVMDDLMLVAMAIVAR